MQLAMLDWTIIGANKLLESAFQLREAPDWVTQRFEQDLVHGDPLEQFVVDGCDLGPDLWIAPTDFRNAYRDWLIETKQPRYLADSPTIPTRLAKRHDVYNHRTGQARKYVGIALKPNVSAARDGGLGIN